MNVRGVLFTTMLLLMVLSMLALISVLETGKREGESYGGLIAFEEADYFYENIQRNVVRVSESGKNKELMERLLPFSYELNGKSIVIEQMLPVNEIEFDNFFDLVNAYEVFLEDEDFGNEFTGMGVVVETVRNDLWGGSVDDINFLINPFCVKLSEDLNSISFEETESVRCSGSFSSANIARYDVNIEVLRASEDFNALLCNGGSCPSEAFSELDPDPYFRIEIIDANCAGCDLSQTVISKHFNPETEEFLVSIYCTGGECTSKAIGLLVGGELLIVNPGNQMRVSVGYVFEEEITGFDFLDFNYSIENSGFRVNKSNYEEFT